MTTEKILLEVGPELDTLIAENIMGWKRDDQAVTSFSESTDAAFDLLKTLKGKGIYLARLSNGWDGDKWHCRLASEDYSKSWDSPKVDSAAHAICLAALETIKPE